MSNTGWIFSCFWAAVQCWAESVPLRLQKWGLKINSFRSRHRENGDLWYQIKPIRQQPQPCGTAAPSDFSQLWIMEVELAMNSSIPAFCVSNSQKTSHVEQAEQCAVFSFNSKQIKYGPHPVSPIVDTGFLLTSAELVTTLLLLKSVNFVHWVVWHFV